MRTPAPFEPENTTVCASPTLQVAATGDSAAPDAGLKTVCMLRIHSPCAPQPLLPSADAPCGSTPCQRPSAHLAQPHCALDPISFRRLLPPPAAAAASYSPRLSCLLREARKSKEGCREHGRLRAGTPHRGRASSGAGAAPVSRYTHTASRKGALPAPELPGGQREAPCPVHACTNWACLWGGDAFRRDWER